MTSLVDITAAAELLDFGRRLGREGASRARQQLEGAVAIHNMLQREGVAYLADEVGMGKTLVALGALALFRHYDPSFRVLVIAPRENIQRKWQKEWRNFVQHNVRFSDMRVRALDGGPLRPLVHCHKAVDAVREASVDPNRDFFMRLPSFSIGLPGVDEIDKQKAEALREALRRSLPWLPAELFDMRRRHEFKDNIGRALNAGLPMFDLVIVDEAHNLKHGLKEGAAARNRVLAFAFGHKQGRPQGPLIGEYGPRARRVLFLSATPIEDSYRHLWNQLDVFGKGDAFRPLRDADGQDDAAKALVSRFLVRRVSELAVGQTRLTKNLYRREWRQGGVDAHDEPMAETSARQRLVVGLVQKKVSEVLGESSTKRSFQIGMLASFESFMQTAKAQVANDGSGGAFDDAGQTDDPLEREGVDVPCVNRLATSYRKTFGKEMPHPKMDAVVARLAKSWERGEKTLVFVRRVASVKELKRKLDESYDEWLLKGLRQRLPASALPDFERSVQTYREERQKAIGRGREEGVEGNPRRRTAFADRGGYDTFFAWFFRGDGPKKVISGANVQRRFSSSRGAFGVFFEIHHVADMLGCRPGGVVAALSRELGRHEDDIRAELRERGRKYCGQGLRRDQVERFRAAQAAACELLAEYEGPLQEKARILREAELFLPVTPHAGAPPDLSQELEVATFFTELEARPSLRERVWPEVNEHEPRERIRERVMRAALLASAARLGHAFIDLYISVVHQLGGIHARAQLQLDEDGASDGVKLMRAFLDELDRQRETPLSERSWGGYDELAEISTHFHLILEVNDPGIRKAHLTQCRVRFGSLLREQQPVGGMYQAVNETMVRQFRMPGYPFVLVSTELLQEGEDLHTFCSTIHHYGIAWTSSSMEQRIGRLDRVRSATERRLSALGRVPKGDEKLQVHYPYLHDTVEVLQVRRVLERVDRFIRMMHEGLQASGHEERRLQLDREIHLGVRMPPVISEELRSAFPVAREHLKGRRKVLQVTRRQEQEVRERMQALKDLQVPGLNLKWGDTGHADQLSGQVSGAGVARAVRLRLRSVNDQLLVRCSSPLGRIARRWDTTAMRQDIAGRPLQVVLEDYESDSYRIDVEEEVILTSREHDMTRVGWLVGHVVRGAAFLASRHDIGSDPRHAVPTDADVEEVGNG